MRRRALSMLLLPAIATGCAVKPSGKGTLAELRNRQPDVADVKVDAGLDQAMAGYRRFLEETPETAMTPEAMRRLADLQLEKQFGIRASDSKPREMAAPEPAKESAPRPATTASTSASATESEQDFEKRTTAEGGTLASGSAASSPAGDPTGPLEAIALYDRLLTEYPSYADSDQVLYQKARAYDELGRTEEAIATMERMLKANPHSEHFDEVQFRRGEYFYTRRKFRDAENAYSTIIGLGPVSTYYELALYKLGWTLYKQEMYEEALGKYMALLDYKVSIGYDFDKTHDEDDERRVADTFRVISFAFTNLGGPPAVPEYFAKFGHRGYEDRIYGNLGEHYLAKLRYDDAAKSFKAFVALYPYHRTSPRFSMRVIETFTQGGFPKLVLESKKEFATSYGLSGEYWKHFSPAESPEVVGYLKSNLKDLAGHYHAQYQNAELAPDKPANYAEARRWYGEFLASFPADPDSPPINYQLAGLLLENKDFGEAAKQYERTAYEYPAHEQSAAAGYAAIYAYREALKVADDASKDGVKRDTVASSLKFVDTFPAHEHAAAILGAAADDLFEMKDYRPAVTAAQRLVDAYPSAEGPIRRSAWLVVAHGSFELAEYSRAETAYTQVLAATPDGDAAKAALVDNLAASIYKQGELANQAQDYRVAAGHFLRIRTAAPTSGIRAAAEYDAGVALMHLKDWATAASVFEAFRSAFPKHELNQEATKQIALAYREGGQTARAASEYERIATESKDPAVRGEALLVAGDLYLQSNSAYPALDVYQRYAAEFPHPAEPAAETHSKIAEIHKTLHDEPSYRKELAEIVRIDAAAGSERTARTRTLAARSSLVLAEDLYKQFVAVRLRQPFEASLEEKKKRMDATIEAMDKLVDYEIADVTAAATFYIAETYFDLSRALATSDRPADLKGEDLSAYEMALEEQAFPLEEKAIDVHGKNLESLHAGVFNAWTEKSLARLAELMPGRYAKSEISSGFLGAIDSYAYRPPIQNLGPAMADSVTPPEEPVEVAPVVAGDKGKDDANPQ
jgi:tetratricopeptide (TPR) repeat protein